MAARLRCYAVLVGIESCDLWCCATDASTAQTRHRIHLYGWYVGVIREDHNARVDTLHTMCVAPCGSGG